MDFSLGTPYCLCLWNISFKCTIMYVFMSVEIISIYKRICKISSDKSYSIMLMYVHCNNGCEFVSWDWCKHVVARRHESTFRVGKWANGRKNLFHKITWITKNSLDWINQSTLFSNFYSKVVGYSSVPNNRVEHAPVIFKIFHSTRSY